MRCPDDGHCHHECDGTTKGCFRVRCCAPLSDAFPNDEWPAELTGKPIGFPEPLEDHNHWTVLAWDAELKEVLVSTCRVSNAAFAREMASWLAEAECAMDLR